MMTLEERLSETRFVHWLVHRVVWPIGCLFGQHLPDQWPLHQPGARATRCLRCRRELPDGE